MTKSQDFILSDLATSACALGVLGGTTLIGVANAMDSMALGAFGVATMLGSTLVLTYQFVCKFWD